MESQSNLLGFNKHAETLLDLPAEFYDGKGSVGNTVLDDKYCNGNIIFAEVWDDKMASSMYKSLSEEQRLPKLNGRGERDSLASPLYPDADPDMATIPAPIAIYGMAVRLPNGIKTP